MTSVHPASTAFSQPSVADNMVNAIHTTASVGAHPDSEDRIVWTLCADPCPTVNNDTPGKAIPANARMAGAESTAMTDQACAGFPLPGELRGLDDEPVQNMTCYKGGLTVNTYYQMCDVTNRKILDMLPGRPPQVTFACDRPSETCNFQFWI
ncbi:hypothetical protein FRC01_012630, partial [Tulasnella sp. 417]